MAAGPLVGGVGTSTDRRLRLQIAWRSLRWRLSASIVMLLVATVSVAAATFGPVYLHGADQSILQGTLRGAPESSAGLTLLAANTSVGTGQLARAAAAAPRGAGSEPLFGQPIITADVPVSSVSKADGQPYESDLISRTDICRHLTFVSGSCPLATGDVGVSTRSARALGLGQGDRIAFSVRGDRHPVVLRITGVYRAGNAQAPYWWGESYFGYGQGSSTAPRLDDFVSTQATISSLPATARTPLLAQLPMVTSLLAADQVSAFEQSLARYERRAPAAFGADASSQADQLLGQVTRDEHTMTTIVAVVLAQLVLLCLIVLYFVAARIGEAREPDVRLAELRGFTRSGIASVALLEPIVLLVLALPLGVLTAWLVGRAVAPSLYESGVTTSIDFLAVGAAVVTFAAGIAAMALGARGLVLRPRGDRPQRGRATGGRPLALAVDAIAVTLAVAAFIDVAISGVSAGNRTDPLAALAPGLLAFGLGVAGARLLPMLAQGMVRLTRDSHWIGATLATRRLARLPELSRHVVVLSMSIGLAAFAVTGWAVAGQNRAIRGEFDVGASRVLTVQAPPGVDFLGAVRRADPSGHQAMAVVIENATDGQTLAVDSTRLAAVASWPAGLSTRDVASVARAIAGHPAPPIVLTGGALRVTADLTRSIHPAPELAATVFDDAYDSDSTLELGKLVPGSHRYQASTAGACQASCWLVSLGITWTGSGGTFENIDVPLDVSAIAARSTSGSWKALPAGLDDPRRWTSTSGGVSIGRHGSGLAVVARVSSDDAPGTFGPDDVPSALPAVVIGAASDEGANLAVGLDGATISVRPVVSVSALPGVGSGATMVDLTLAERTQTDPMIDTTLEVWLAAGTDGAVVKRLESEGISVTSVDTAATKSTELSRSGISLAYSFFLLAACAAALLAIGSTVFAIAAAARRRESELASLQAVGIGRASLRRSLMAEQGLVIGVGIALGVVAGLAAAAVALPSIPEFLNSVSGPPLVYGIPIGPFAVTLGVVVVSLVATVALAARLVIARATSDKLGRDHP